MTESRREPQTPHRSGDLLLLAVILALVAGLAHAATAVVRYRLLHEFTWTSRDVVWMSPLANVVLLLVLAAPFAVLNRVRPNRRTYRAGVLVLTATATFAVLLLIPHVHTVAWLVLAVGVGVAVSAMLTARAAGLSRWLPRMWLVLAMPCAMLGVASRAYRWLGERTAVAALPNAPAGAPNILLIILDTVRASSLHLYGYARPTTPELERFAAQGVAFDRAIAPAPWSLPSHASIFTGRNAGELSATKGTPLPLREHTIAEVLRGLGYNTAAVVGNLAYTTHETGLAQGFMRYEDHPISWRQIFWSSTIGQLPLVSGVMASRTDREFALALRHPDLRMPRRPRGDSKSADRVTTEFLDWQAQAGVRPFFAFLNYFDAHEPYDSPPSFETRFARQPSLHDKYDGAITYIDHELGRLFRELERRGVLDHTIVVVTADHGEQFGEHGLYLHGNSLYMPLIHVPLVVRYPARVPAGVRVATPVSLRDLPSTLLDLAGVTVHFPGTSYASLVRSPDAIGVAPPLAELEARGPTMGGRRAAAGPMRAIVADESHYVAYLTKPDELYDYRADPNESTDLARTPGRRPQMDSLQSLLSEMIDAETSVRSRSWRWVEKLPSVARK